MNTKGQGTIEYLVIIAIVVVIALVVVGLLLQIMGNFGGTGEQSAKIAWSSSEPWAITDWSLTDNTLTLVLKNQTADTMHLNSFCLSDDEDCYDTPITNIAAGDTEVITIEELGCSEGDKFSYPKEDIKIDFNKGSIANMRQNGVADIIGTCN